jgi:hypothetical protein
MTKFQINRMNYYYIELVMRMQLVIEHNFDGPLKLIQVKYVDTLLVTTHVICFCYHKGYWITNNLFFRSKHSIAFKRNFDQITLSNLMSPLCFLK